MKKFWLVVGLAVCFNGVNAQEQLSGTTNIEREFLEGRWKQILGVAPKDAISQFITATTYGLTEEWEKMNEEKSKTDKFPDSTAQISAFCKRISEDNPTNSYAHFLYGTYHLANDNTSKAIEAYEQAATLSPKLAAAYYQIAGINGGER